MPPAKGALVAAEPVKRSLFGQSNVHGSEGVRFYTRTKTVTARWPSGIRQGADYSIPTLR